MFRKFLPGLAPVLAMAPLVAMPVVTQAAVPRWFVNGVRASTKHEGVLAFGPITLHNAILGNIKCEHFFGGGVWNEVQGGTERGFGDTTGYLTWECEATAGVTVTNERGVQQEGEFLTAEEPPEAKTEKAHKSGASSLPWTGELTEKEAGKFFDTTHHVKVWWVIPLCTEMGGTGKGADCELGGNEIPWEDEPAIPGAELAPQCSNGVKNGLSPSKAIFAGQKTEKNGLPETGRLENGSFGAGFLTGSLVTAGSNDFELITCK
jgi:hypothetical protein